jgi:site-specific DNA recombinase
VTKRAVGYLRVSSEAQVENYSLGTQEEDIRRYCAEKGYELLDVVREVYTAMVLEARPVLRQVRKDIQAGRVDVVVVWHRDRLSRDPEARIELRLEADRHGARYESVTDPIGNTDEDRLVDYVRGFGAKQEVKRNTQRSIANSRARMKSGKLPGGGKPRFGYRFEGEGRSRYVANPDTAWVVRRIFDEVADGTPKLTVCKALMRDGIAAPQGRQWRPPTLAGIIRSSYYRGEAIAYRVRQWKDEDGHWHKAVRDTADGDDGFIPLPEGTVERLVSDEVWYRANANLDNARDNVGRRGDDREDVLVRGAVRCGVCGFRMCIHRLSDAVYLRCQAKQRGAGSCQNMIRAAKVDSAVWKRIWWISTNPDYVQQELERQQRSERTVEDTRELDRQIREAGQEVENLATAVGRLSDGAALDTLLALLTDASNRKAALVARKAELDLQRRLVERQRATVRAWYDHGHDLLETIDTWSYKQRRRRLQELGIEVTVWPRTNAKRYEIEASLPVAQELLADIERPDGLTISRLAQGTTPPSPACGSNPPAPCASIAGDSPPHSRTVRQA